MSDRSPAYRDPVLHFDALRLVALREGGMIEETWGKLAAHSRPALKIGLMAPAWRPAQCIWGVTPGLTWRFCSFPSK